MNCYTTQRLMVLHRLRSVQRRIKMADEGLNSDGNVNSISNHETDEEKLERLHFKKVVEAFLFYEEFASRRVKKVESSFNEIPRHHREMLPNFNKHIKEVRRCIHVNQEFLRNIVSCTEGMFENRETGQCSGESEGHCLPPITSFDMDKISTTLKQFVRDWAEEGKCEREACYVPILQEIKELFPSPQICSKDVSILVPGAGLGRLMFEIAKLGYRCQGNEWSLYMLFASHYVLNRSSGVNESVIHPYIGQWCNVKASSDQIRPIRIPDVDPRNIESGVEFSMAAGNFLDVYAEGNCWDCIATCFFIDTAHNVIEYIEHIWKILKPGGYWINLGPLLYHFSGMANEFSLDLSYEDIKRIITQTFSFEILKEKVDVSSGYVENCQSMLKMNYESVFFVARKPL